MGDLGGAGSGVVPKACPNSSSGTKVTGFVQEVSKPLLPKAEACQRQVQELVTAQV
jgi:hypothetical protein